MNPILVSLWLGVCLAFSRARRPSVPSLGNCLRVSLGRSSRCRQKLLPSVDLIVALCGGCAVGFEKITARAAGHWVRVFMQLWFWHRQ